MSDSDEAADGQRLAYEEARKLFQRKPDHELLRYALHPDDDGIWDEFITRFGKPGLSRDAQRAYPAIAYLYAKYWIALSDACANPEKVIMVDQSPMRAPTAVPFTPVGSYSITDDDIPY